MTVLLSRLTWRLVTVCMGLMLAVPVSAQSNAPESISQRLKGLDDHVEQLSNYVEQLKSQVNELKSAAITVQSGTFPMVAQGTRGLRDSSLCPNGPDAYRGMVNRRIDFPEGFSEPPKVELALRDATISSETRVILKVISIDPNGFNFTFATYCKTIIYGANAVWVAYGRTSE